MNLDQYVGRTIDEEAFFLELIFEIETHRHLYQNKHFIFLLENQPQGKILISGLKFFNSNRELSAETITYLKKKRWCQFNHNPGQKDLMIIYFVQLSLETRVAQIYLDDVIVNQGRVTDPSESCKELTLEEIQDGFRELCGVVKEFKTKSRPKRAI